MKRTTKERIDYQNRRTRLSRYYRPKFTWADWCIYCGQPAKQQDHVLPLRHADTLDLRNPNIRAKYRRVLVTVPCCISCNQLDRFAPLFTSIIQKRQFLHRKMLKNADLLKRRATWPRSRYP